MQNKLHCTMLHTGILSTTTHIHFFNLMKNYIYIYCVSVVIYWSSYVSHLTNMTMLQICNYSLPYYIYAIHHSHNPFLFMAYTFGNSILNCFQMIVYCKYTKIPLCKFIGTNIHFLHRCQV